MGEAGDTMQYDNCRPSLPAADACRVILDVLYERNSYFPSPSDYQQPRLKEIKPSGKRINIKT